METQIFLEVCGRDWLSALHGRHKMLVWRLLSDIMPTRQRLGLLFQVRDISCILCDHDLESAHHLLLDCSSFTVGLPFMLAIWWMSKWQISLQVFSHISANEWIMLILDPTNQFPLDAKAKYEIIHFTIVAFEQMWLCRNKKLKGEDLPDLPNVCSSINRLTL